MNDVLKPLVLGTPRAVSEVAPLQLACAPVPAAEEVAPAAPQQAAAVSLPDSKRALIRIARTSMRGMTIKLLKDQGGVCAICGDVIDLSIPREAVMDHDHKTGEVRGILHRSCNGAEGKVANAAGRWGAGGMDYALIVPWLERMIAYLKQPGTGYMYPTHKTPEELAAKAKLRRKQQRASTNARAKVRSMKKKES